MNFKSIVASISSLEFINKLDSLCNDLLYAPDDGYIYKTSRDAIYSKEEYLNKFLNEANKLKENELLNGNNDLILKKKHN